jgi:hypothetical protein
MGVAAAAPLRGGGGQADRWEMIALLGPLLCGLALAARQANEGESLDVQRRQLRGYAEMHWLVIDDIVVEEGVSG